MADHPGEITGNVLIVDDTPANLRLLSQMLTENGHTVRAATTGARALVSVETALPDLILLDIRMPGMDGYEVCARLKESARTRNIPVIFISALDDLQDKMAAFAAGGVDYITKPFQLQEVMARVSTHLHLRHLQRQLQDSNRRFRQQLQLAGEIQSSFLPNTMPDIPGWHVSAALQPAMETSGDFYDVVPLTRGRTGFVVADVVDKGVGAALYMALSRTVIRTQAMAHPDDPASALAAANRRILEDTRANQFVTVFYVVLDPEAATMIYCNAGHNPPLWSGADGGRDLRRLARTGMPLGIFEDVEWEHRSIELGPGDTVVLYSDGLTDALNSTGASFGDDRLRQIVRAGRGQSPDAIKSDILREVAAFVGQTPTFDDITLMVIGRDPAS